MTKRNGKIMSYDELMDKGKKYFNFSPDEEFNNPEHILVIARRNHRYGYEFAAAMFAEDLARYVGENNQNDKRKRG